MSLVHTIAGKVGRFYFERQGKKSNLSEHVTNLKNAGEDLEKHFAPLSGNEDHKRVLSHIIGIERWGQQRLKVMQGVALTMDEYNKYRPAREVSWQDLKSQFTDTRQETVAIAQELTTGKTANNLSAPHNQFGDLSLGAWLGYLTSHATIEGKRMK